MLNKPDILSMLLSKLSGAARNVLAIHISHIWEPDLTDATHFVNYPIFLKVEQYFQKKQNSKRTNVSSFAAKEDGKVLAEKKSTDCNYCSEYHILGKCSAFIPNIEGKDQVFS